MARDASVPPTVTDRSEGFGERLLGTMIERAHEMPPQLIAPLVAEVIAAIGGSDVTVLLQDDDQTALVPLPGRGLQVGIPEPIQDSPAGEAFQSDTTVELPVPGGVRLFLPLLDGTDRVGVLAFTAGSPDQDDRRLARRFAGLLADVLVTNGLDTDRFFQTRRQQPMSLPAEMAWSLLPPLSMTTPQVAVAGILEPAYRVAGDSFGDALNDDILHLAIIDAMGHALTAERGGVTSDDPTLFLPEWRNEDPSHVAVLDAERSAAPRRSARLFGGRAGGPVPTPPCLDGRPAGVRPRPAGAAPAAGRAGAG